MTEELPPLHRSTVVVGPPVGIVTYFHFPSSALYFWPFCRVWSQGRTGERGPTPDETWKRKSE